ETSRRGREHHCAKVRQGDIAREPHHRTRLRVALLDEPAENPVGHRRQREQSKRVALRKKIRRARRGRHPPKVRKARPAHDLDLRRSKSSRQQYTAHAKRCVHRLPKLRALTPPQSAQAEPCSRRRW